ncbi:hypothetical protein [Paenibacillus sp. YYML68]|uniref:DUF7667 family protein n=1 Tax=Paenibacillus sp. YYML68 TaxID=2909250 RepID=UPI0024905F7C|nr:hypothetical protein [Paenibacillus sp. YYML68]
MLPFHYRMAELWTYHQTRELTDEEQQELSLCLQANANFVGKLVELHNCITAATIAGDKMWLKELNYKLAEQSQQLQLQFNALRTSRFNQSTASSDPKQDHE